MSEIRQSPNNGNLILLGAGILCLFGGLTLTSECSTFASLFLGARLLFGLPFSDVDRLKVLFIEGAGSLLILQGVVLFLVGLVRLIRSGNGAPQSTAAVKPIGQ